MAVSRRLKFGLIALAAVGAVAFAAYRLAPDFLATPADRARSAYDRGDYREARRLVVEILKREPDDPTALRIMARSSGRLGGDDMAMTLFSRIGEGGMEPEDFFILASVLELRGQAPAALAVLERGQLARTNHAGALELLARLLARGGRLPEAIATATSLARCPEWEARGSLILGVLDVEQDDPAAAALAIDRALKVDPKLVGGITSPTAARKLLAGAWLRTAEADRAIEALGPLLGSGDDPEAFWLGSRAFLQRRDGPALTSALARSGDFGKEDPTRAEPGPYVGSKACQVCHPAIYQAQRQSRHSRTYFGPADLDAVRLPDGPIADKALPEISHTLRRVGKSIRLTTRTHSDEFSAAIAYAVGSGDRGLTLVARDDKGLDRVCRISSYLGGTLWDLTSNAPDPHADDPGGPLGRPMSPDAAAKCVACHVTSLPAARDRSRPEAADRGIGCERCHGPGGHHLMAVNLKLTDPAIARPSLASPSQILKLCGTCHQADDPSITEADPRFARFQAASLPLSRCYSESLGGMSCVTCHDPHRDADPDPASYVARCLDCHGPMPTALAKVGTRGPPIVSEAMRRVVCPVEPTSGCVACHMPKVEGAAPHAVFSDHRIRRRPAEIKAK